MNEFVRKEKKRHVDIVAVKCAIAATAKAKCSAYIHVKQKGKINKQSRQFVS
jgi:hypothetical protein